jgi:hypothetical protein
VSVSVQVLECRAWARPLGLEQPPDRGCGDVGRAQVVAAEADVGGEQITGFDEVDQFAGTARVAAANVA